MHSHVGRGRGQLQTFSTKWRTWNWSECLAMLKHSELLWLELRGQAWLLTTNPTPDRQVPSPGKQQTRFSNFQVEKHYFPHSSVRVSTALESIVVVLYTNASDAFHCNRQSSVVDSCKGSVNDEMNCRNVWCKLPKMQAQKTNATTKSCKQKRKSCKEVQMCSKRQNKLQTKKKCNRKTLGSNYAAIS